MTATTTRAATATTAGLILALDFGKYKSVACAYDRGPAPRGPPRPAARRLCRLSKNRLL